MICHILITPEPKKVNWKNLGKGKKHCAGDSWTDRFGIFLSRHDLAYSSLHIFLPVSVSQLDGCRNGTANKSGNKHKQWK